jgi:DNA-binding transcriptional LysR family regulator
MEIRHLRYFVTVAGTLHFGRAAEQLHMSQPPLSARVADLERELGVQLLERSPRIALTRVGVVFLDKARRALEAFDEAGRAMDDLSHAAGRALRAAAPPDTSRKALAAVIGTMRTVGLAARITILSTADQRHALLHRDLDLGVLRHPFPARGLIVSKPLTKALGVAVPDGSVLARSPS